MDNVKCDVCLSPESYEDNEMVVCGVCTMVVHQNCYGILTIPTGAWLCQPCSMSIEPDCVLCPNKGGAMKSTKSGHEWAHVTCALWIPETSVGCVNRMEPITNISSIPDSRWALICVLCGENIGACVQCSKKSCKIAYHVTCGFRHGVKMVALIYKDENENEEDIPVFISYCLNHSIGEGSDTDNDDTSDSSDTDGN